MFSKLQFVKIMSNTLCVASSYCHFVGTICYNYYREVFYKKKSVTDKLKKYKQPLFFALIKIGLGNKTQ